MQNNNITLIKAISLLLISMPSWGMRSNIVLESHYGILGIEPTATPREIKKAYLKKAKMWHPDKNPDDIEQANQRFKAIGQALDILSDKHSRAAYDEQLAHELRQSIYTTDRDLAQTIDPGCLDALLSSIHNFLKQFSSCSQEQ